MPDGLAIFAAHGIPWAEIHGYSAEEFDFSDRALVDTTVRALDRLGLRVWSCHSPAGGPLDLASPDPVQRTRTLAAMQHALHVTATLGARVFVCDAVGPDPAPPAERTARRLWLADALAQLLEAATPLGCRVAIENHTREEGMFVTPDHFRDLVADRRLDELGACWDTGHGWIESHRPEVACRLGPRLLTLHIHDNDGRDDQHRLPTTGGIDWPPFIGGLARMPYRGPFMLELAPPVPTTVDAIDRLVRDAVNVCARLLGVGSR